MGELINNVELTSAEIANLWTQYMNDSLSYCILRHSINCCKDSEIKDVLEFAAVGYFGAGASISQRRDLAMEYATLMGEVGLYAEDGAELLIKYGWLEQPPMAIDREKLANM